MTQRSFDPTGLRNQFPGSANLKHNYSQADQDIFVLSMLNGKRNGTYLEIGCNESFANSNTALLETEFGWYGIGIDFYKPWIDSWSRQNPVEQADGLSVDFLDLLKRYNIGPIVDYLSIDCDPPHVTFEILKRLPFESVQFAVITFEHDCHAWGSDVKNQSRLYLESKGYQLIVCNISDQGLARDFEDWWVHPKLVDADLIATHTDLRDLVKDYKWYLYNRIPDCLKSTTWVDQFYQKTPD